MASFRDRQLILQPLRTRVHGSGGVYRVIDAGPPAGAPSVAIDNRRQRARPSSPLSGRTKSPQQTGNLDATVAALEISLLSRRSTRRGDETSFCCPFHDDVHPSASYNTAKRAFRCFSCGEQGRSKKLADALGVSPGTSDDSKGMAALAGIYEASLTAPWGGRTGGYDQAVLHAILAECFRRGRPVVALSYREISLAAGVSLATVSKSVRRLSAKRGEQRDGTRLGASGIMVLGPERSMGPSCGFGPGFFPALDTPGSANDPQTDYARVV
jgi:hypothetical protein